MKNWEFYEEEIKKYKLAFAMKDNQMYNCASTPCEKCIFDMGESCTCDIAKVKWLYQECKEPVVLTDDEKALCKLLGRGWIARDKDDTLWWYIDKPPTKSTNEGNAWHNIGGLCAMIHSIFPQCKFNFIKWEDEEPWEVKVDD